MKNQLFLLLLACTFFCCKNQFEQQPDEDNIPFGLEPTNIFYDTLEKPFYHGVASGDPSFNSVWIWTRVTPDFQKAVKGKWRVFSDKEKKNLVQTGDFQTDSISDYTVKVQVPGLIPNTYYFYEFEAFGKNSPLGRTKTFSKKNVPVKIAVASCSNYEAGYFNAYAKMADEDSLDAILHLGDYIYEYPPNYYADTTLDRKHLPAKEIIALSDYRTRYAQYRLDKDLQRVHQMHPFITIWDDHEIANNAFIKGAENHQAEEGDYLKRKAAARQAYYEWLPIAETENLYRNFSIGSNVEIFMLDERIAGRTAPVESVSQTNFTDEGRTMLGESQLNWFKKALRNSSATWKVVGNQVIFSDLDISPIFPERILNLDAWDGYPAEQNAIRDFLETDSIENVIFVTGDTHASWAFEVAKDVENYKKIGTKDAVAVEFGTTSISSANYDEYSSVDTAQMAADKYRNPKLNPHLKYANLHDHGYLILKLFETHTLAEWHYVDAVNVRVNSGLIGQRFLVRAGSPKLERLEN